MWTPIRIKPNTQARGWKPEGGWFCYDTITLTVDLRQRYTGKQAAQKECDRRNRDEMAKKTDGKLRNPKRWYTVGYIDSSEVLVTSPYQENLTHYYGYLSELLRQSIEILQGGHIRNAVCSVIWQGRLSRSETSHNLPYRLVHLDGDITHPKENHVA